MIEFSIPPVQLLTLVVGTIFPLLVGLVTVRVTHPGKKAALLALLSALGGLGGELITALTTGTAYDLGVGAMTALATFLVAVGMYYGFWKPSGVAESLQKFGETDEAAAKADAASSTTPQQVVLNVTAPDAEGAAESVTRALRRDLRFRGE